jgi:ribosomal protein L3
MVLQIAIVRVASRGLIIKMRAILMNRLLRKTAVVDDCAKTRGRGGRGWVRRINIVRCYHAWPARKAQRPTGRACQSSRIGHGTWPSAAKQEPCP